MDFSHLVCSYISLFCSPSISDFFNMWGGFHKYFLYLFLEFVVSLFLNFLIEGWCQIINTRSEASENRVFDMWYVTYDVLCLIII